MQQGALGPQIINKVADRLFKYSLVVLVKIGSNVN